MIIICDYCKNYVCPSTCPSFDGYMPSLGESVAICSTCEQRLYEDEEIYCYNDKYICKECAEELIPSELLEFLDCADIKEFFDMLL